MDKDVELLLSDRLWRLNNLYKVKNEDYEVVTFKLRPVQEELLLNFWNKNIILKARQFGITTFMCIFQLDAILFESNIETMIIAHKEDEAKDFFQKKILFAYDCLPEFLRKLRPAVARRGGELRLSHGGPNYSSVRVSTSGRGGTLRYLHVSEFGKVCAKHPDQAAEIISGALNAGVNQVTTFESTAEGAYGPFYEICVGAEDMERQGVKLTSMDYRFFFMPWYKHPRYVLDADFEIDNEYFDTLDVELSDSQKRWYLKKEKEQGTDMMRQEFPSTSAEAFAKTLEGTYYDKQLRRDDILGDYGHVSGYPVHVASDIGVSDATVMIFFQIVEDRMRVIESVSLEDGDLDTYVLELRKRGDYEIGVQFAPHDIAVKEWGSGRTRSEQAWDNFGIKFIRIERTKSIVSDINFVRASFRDIEIDAQGNDMLVKALRAYRKIRNERLGIWQDKPYHDWSSDWADAFRYGVMGYSQLVSGEIMMRDMVKEGGIL